MTDKRPTTIPEYIAAAPVAGHAHLQQLYELLQYAAPNAQEAIKWGNPFFIEPRFLFAFSAHKAHLNFVPPAATFEHFRKELEQHSITKGTLKVLYKEPIPEDLIRRMAEYSVKLVSERETDSFW